MKLHFRILLIVGLFLLPAIVFAGSKATTKHVYIGPHEVIDGNFLAIGETVTVEGTVNGDVIVAGGKVFISGVVAGDVVATGGQIQITGPVQGNLRLLGWTVKIDGVIGKNVTIAAGNVELSRSTAVGWGTMIMARNANVSGKIIKDLRVWSEFVTINGAINGDVLVKADELVLQGQTLIGGDLLYSTKTAAEVLYGSTIEGEVKFEQLPVSDYRDDFFGWLVFKILIVLSLLLLGLAKIFIIPKHLEMASNKLKKQRGISLVWGILALLITPAVVFVLLMTGIGWAVAIMTAALYVMGILYSIIIVSTVAGEWVLLKITGRHWRGVSAYWSMVVGVLLFVVVTSIPIFGLFVGLLLIASGLGALIVVDRKEIKKYQ